MACGIKKRMGATDLEPFLNGVPKWLKNIINIPYPLRFVLKLHVLTRGWHCDFILKPLHCCGLLNSRNFEVVLDSTRRIWSKTKLWAGQPRRLKWKYDLKRADVVISFSVIHIYWANAEWWLSGTGAPPWPSHEWRCKWKKEKVKAFSDTKHTQRAVVQNAQPQNIKDAAPPSEQPLGTHHIPSIYIFIQTNIWLLMPHWGNDNRQMCPPQRISCCSASD